MHNKVVLTLSSIATYNTFLQLKYTFVGHKPLNFHLILEFFVGVKKFENTQNAMKMHILTRKNLECYLLLGISVFMQPNALVQQSM